MRLIHSEDKELMEEFEKAYAIASPYREKVSFRHDLLVGDGRRIEDHKVTDMVTSEVYLDALHLTADIDLCNVYTKTCGNCGEMFWFTLMDVIGNGRKIICNVCDTAWVSPDSNEE